MADQTYRIPNTNIILKFKDNGDDTHSLISSVYNQDAGNCPDAVDSVEYEASGIIKADAGILYQISGYNSKATAQFIQLFNTTAVPADTAVPVVVIKVAAESSFSISFAPYGKIFDTGICWSNSSTGPTKTIGSADVWINALFK